MRLRQVLNISLLFLFFGCRTKNETTIKQTYKDSVLKQYIDYTSQLPFFFDKSSYDYRFINAYYRNDTAFLKKASDDIAVNDQKKGDGFPDSCRRHPIIEQLKLDYVYQLDYSKSFCNLNYYFTITKNKDTIILQSVIYQGDNEMKTYKVVKENATKLTQQNWDEFIESIQFADFWGLNQYKKFGCCDGDYLTVKAIERNWKDHSLVQEHKVARQFVTNTALFKTCELLAKFSNCDMNCKL
jgi:hypothetical protein